MTSRLARFRALSKPEKQVLIAASLLLPAFWIGLRLLGMRRFCTLIDRPVAVTGTTLPGEDPAAIGTLVNIAGNHGPFPSTCLTRSLLLNWLLHRRGVNSQLRIGVRRTHDKLEAHAWVEYQGWPVNDAQDVSERFAAFDGPLSPGSFSSP